MSIRRPLYLAVEGPIGVGKTTLVHRLAERLQGQVLLEVVEENPFLPRFYEDRDRYAFQTQLFFLMSRFKQQQDLMQADLFTPDVVADYHLLKDRIFAQLTLTDDELALYERVYTSLETHILQPDLVIYLYARLDILLARIAKRARPFEADFDADYLAKLSRAYQHFFTHYDRAKVYALDTSEIDYVHSDEAFEAIYREVLRRAGRGDDPA